MYYNDVSVSHSYKCMKLKYIFIVSIVPQSQSLESLMTIEHIIIFKVFFSLLNADHKKTNNKLF